MSRLLLLIADIGGYTGYMRMHRIGLAHAQANTARLLEAVIDAVPMLELREIEGDAAFMSTSRSGELAAGNAIDAAVSMHRAFHVEQERMKALNLCTCAGCVAVGTLKLKCVAHVGDVVEQTIRTARNVVGLDVILVHRMLKNPVPVEEYVLLSDELFGTCDAAIRDMANAVDHELEGIGRARSYYVDLEALAEPLPPAARITLAARAAETFRTIRGGFPYVIGLRKLRHR